MTWGNEALKLAISSSFGFCELVLGEREGQQGGRARQSSVDARNVPIAEHVWRARRSVQSGRQEHEENGVGVVGAEVWDGGGGRCVVT